MLTGLVRAFVALRENSDCAAGIFIGLSVFKFQFAIPTIAIAISGIAVTIDTGTTVIAITIKPGRVRPAVGSDFQWH
jgi:hypothetical protein